MKQHKRCFKSVKQEILLKKYRNYRQEAITSLLLLARKHRKPFPNRNDTLDLCKPPLQVALSNQAPLVIASHN